MSLAVEHVTVSFGDSTVLRDVELCVADEEVVAVLGPSGCGKTTLLRVIAGLVAPSSGLVRLDGRDITDLAPHRRGIGMVFQDHALFPHRDVHGNVAFGLRMAGTSRAEVDRRVGEVLELVGLSGFERRSVEGLSGGERQRVALARALAPRPSVLLLDEPLGSLDRALRDRLLEDLTELLEASRVTVVHVTHDPGEAFATGDRVVVMRNGTIAQVGTPAEIWRHPVDAEVARSVGPVSFVPVEVDAGGAVIAPWGPTDLKALRSGTGALLMLRPDSLEVVDARDAALHGIVVGRLFKGDHVLARVRIEISPGETIEVAVAERAGAVPEPGEEVGLVLLPGATLVE